MKSRDRATILERAISSRACRQKGAITRRQLYSLGMSRHAIDRRLRSGRFHPMHRGVYLVGHTAPAMAWEAAAILACGPRAAVSHASAGHLWRLLPRRSRPRPHERSERHEVDVTAVGRDPGRRPGIRLHRVDDLDPRDIRSIDGIPVTSAARTLLDLAASLTTRELEQAVAEGYARRVVKRSHLVAVIARYPPRRRGSRPLGQLLELDRTPALTRSEAEERLLALIRAAELPPAEVNARLGPYEVDFLCRRHNLVVEIDGFAFHSSRSAFEPDRARDAYLIAEGFRVIRVTWRQVTRRPEATAALIARALGPRP
jgi:very-short-patch-repair endonuclease